MKQNTVCEAVIERVKELLVKNKITLYRLAFNSGIIYSTLKNIMANKNKSVDFALVIQIAGGFDMTIEQFVASPLFLEDNLKI